MPFNEKLIKNNYPLKDLTTFRIGGPADFYYEAETAQDIVDAVNHAKSKNIPYFIIGGGSNLVISDKGIAGLVIHNCIKNIKKVDTNNKTITLSTGHKLSELVDMAEHEGFTGAEPFAGIPGSLGGAICGNAGAYGKSISDILLEAEILLSNGVVKIVNKDFFDFSYRSSILKREPHIVLSATFALKQGNREAISQEIEEIKATRKTKHPGKEIGCAGSFFKNLPPEPGESRRRAAGEVLEKIGAKGMHFGGAFVYEKHANFIINKGDAKASDVKSLAKILINKVKEGYGVELEEEVRYVGRWD
ncbi:MAG: UDP-N-acetylmuramate dehydrogenase [Candidatus Riflebacteria bacterium]|nr:UDP-N-acetylmuramate dehydrogenase [Candidatus Riflebacteria bacterium]